MAKKAEERPSAKQVEEVLLEMAAPVIPAAARPSHKLQAVTLPMRSKQTDEHGQHLSTLGRGVGQMSQRATMRLRHFLLRQTERSPWLVEHTSPQQRLGGMAIGALLLTLGIVAGGVSLLRGTERAAVVQPPVATVRWSLTTSPPGARVVRQHDHAVLGQTPFVQERPSSPGNVELVLQLDGYKDRVLTLDGSRDVQLTETLESSTPPAAAAPVDSGGRRGKKGSKVGAHDGSAKRGKHGDRTRLID